MCRSDSSCTIRISLLASSTSDLRYEVAATNDISGSDTGLQKGSGHVIIDSKKMANLAYLSVAIASATAIVVLDITTEKPTSQMPEKRVDEGVRPALARRNVRLQSTKGRD